MSFARAVVLMPSFGQDASGGLLGDRQVNQDAVLAWYESRGVPVVLGGDLRVNGRFSRARAVNRAARVAAVAHADRDAFIIADNDLIPSEPHLRDALAVVDDRAAITPHARTLYLTHAATRAYRTTGVVGDGDVRAIGSRSYVVLRRSVFARVNGMDELFTGWGPEDKAFLASIRAQVGAPLELDGTRVHLWHPIDPTRTDAKNVARNRNRWWRYENATPEIAFALAREYGTLGMEAA